MEQAWRWFGPQDPVTLDNVKQAGATGIVSALHQITSGEAWTEADVRARRDIIEARGLRWAVVESIPVHDDIKTRRGDWRRYLDNWKASLRACAAGGVSTICYNFMPVVDWTRTDLMYPMPSTGFALRFDMVDFAVYDIFILARPGAAESFTDDVRRRAEARFATMDEARQALLERTIIAGLPGSDFSFDRATVRARLASYAGIGPGELRANLIAFLEEVVPVAEAVGARLCIHPDDPPFPLLGLPRILSTEADAATLLDAVDHPANGLTFCVGSYGSRGDNDLPAMVRRFGPRIHFAHLRNTTRDADGSFTESDHLDGHSDMVAVVAELMREETRRTAEGRADAEIPFRPDHGHLLADDIGKTVNPGYSCIGRLKGLAELRGVIRAIAAVRSGAVS